MDFIDVFSAVPKLNGKLEEKLAELEKKASNFKELWGAVVEKKYAAIQEK